MPHGFPRFLVFLDEIMFGASEGPKCTTERAKLNYFKFKAATRYNFTFAHPKIPGEASDECQRSFPVSSIRAAVRVAFPRPGRSPCAGRLESAVGRVSRRHHFHERHCADPPTQVPAVSSAGRRCSDVARYIRRG